MEKVESIHLASTHPPFDTRILQKECKTLATAGYRVTLIVPHDREQVVEGIRNHAIPKPQTGKERLTKTIWQVYRAVLTENPRPSFTSMMPNLF